MESALEKVYSSKSKIENNLPHEVVTVNTGIEAMEILRKQKFNLVIASIEMKFINGFRIVAFMKNEPTLNKTPVFLTTSSEDLNILEEIKNSEFLMQHLSHRLLSFLEIESQVKNISQQINVGVDNRYKG